MTQNFYLVFPKEEKEKLAMYEIETRLLERAVDKLSKGFSETCLDDFLNKED